MIKPTGFSLAAALLALSAVGCGSAPPPPAAPAAPSIASSKDVAPGTEDFDHDGVPDSADKCPDKKEDGLPPQPADGCPKAL